MALDTMQDAIDVEPVVSCARFNFSAGNSVQPKTNFCAQCTAHKFALCAKLSGNDLAAFGAGSVHKKIEAGQMLFSECDDASYLYTVVEGEVRLSRMLDDGRRQITGFKSEGDFVGLSADGKYAADAEAINDVTVCQFSVSGLNHSLEEYTAVQSRLMEMMQEEVVNLQNQMLLLGRKTPIEKMANFIAERVKRNVEHGRIASDANTVEISLPMSRTDIADFLGLTIETVSRTFTKLRKLGVIELKTSQNIIVSDLSELQFLADGDV